MREKKHQQLEAARRTLDTANTAARTPCYEYGVRWLERAAGGP